MAASLPTTTPTISRAHALQLHFVGAPERAIDAKVKAYSDLIFRTEIPRSLWCCVPNPTPPDLLPGYRHLSRGAKLEYLLYLDKKIITLAEEGKIRTLPSVEPIELKYLSHFFPLGTTPTLYEGPVTGIDWSDVREKISLGIPGIRKGLEEPPPDNYRDSLHIACSEVLTFTGGEREAKLLLGNSAYLNGDQVVRGNSTKDQEARLYWKKHHLSEEYNPHRVSTVLTFGTQIYPLSCFLPTGVHEEFIVQDDYVSASHAKRELITLLQKISGHPKECFSDVSILHKGRTGHSSRDAYVIEDGTLSPDISIDDLFCRPFLLISTALLRGESVFVHCAAGISRSATVVTAYLMFVFGLTRDEALHIVRASRSFIKPNPLWHSLLTEYERLLKEAGIIKSSSEDHTVAEPIL